VDDSPEPLRRLPETPDKAPKTDRQFSLAEFVMLTVAIGLAFSVTTTIARLLPGGLTPGTFAGLLGLGTLLGMVVIAVIPAPRRIVWLSWWIMAAMYIASCVVAVVLG